MATGHRHRFVFIPQISSNSFLLFFEKQPGTTSWSVRDYSSPGRVDARYGSEFGWKSGEALAKAKFAFDAPVVAASRLEFWHRETALKNRQYLGANLPLPPAAHSADFPVLDLEELRSSSKGTRRSDLHRILTSPDSEDWLTWNFLRLLTQVHPTTWPQTILPFTTNSTDLDLVGASLHFWTSVASPRRRRTDAPLEGPSEIDVILESPSSLVYIEAKLGSDVSTRTRHDPARNQIVRNIDCLLSNSGDRQAAFWMLVRDTDPARLYCQLLESYRSRPEILVRELPHHHPSALRQVANRLSLIRWPDLASSWIENPVPDPLAESVRREILERI